MNIILKGILNIVEVIYDNVPDHWRLPGVVVINSRKVGHIPEDKESCIRNQLDVIGIAININANRAPVLTSRKTGQRRESLINVLINKIVESLSEKIVYHENNVLIVTNSDANLPKIISIIKIGANDFTGFQITLAFFMKETGVKGKINNKIKE